MDTITRHVRDIDATVRRALETVLGRPLRENQQVIIQVVTPGEPAAVEVQEKAITLPDWCNVYEGLTEKQIDDVEEAILPRSDWTRPSS